MAKLHVIAVGGTGHKILQSIIHIAACGAFKGDIGSSKIDTLRVLTVDADDSNGNLNQTKNTLSNYQKFYNTLSGSSELGLVNIEAIEQDINLRLFYTDKNSISKTFNIPKYAQPELADLNKLIRFLYTNEEINAEFNQGFYGHTSIGTLIVKDIISQDSMWKKFITGISDNDFVMVAGSIFGGTGASSIPVIIEELKRKRKDVQFYTAAMMLTPYFNTVGVIQEEGELQPDCASFHIKAKASLYYYHDQKQNQMVDALYVIGEPEINFSNERSSRGAANQCNKAHPMELFAATSVLDFIREAKNINASHNIRTAERETDNDGRNYYTWKMLQSSSQNLSDSMKAFMKVAIFYNKVIYSSFINKESGIWRNYYDKLDEMRDSNNNLMYQNIYEYFKLFINYIYDLHKKNQKEIDQNSGMMKWEPDVRVKLFNAQNNQLFDNIPVQNGIIKDFDELVIGQNDGMRSEKIYNDLHVKPKSQSKDFVALFSTLYEIIVKPSKTGFFSGFGKKSATVTNDLKNIPYLSNDNGTTLQRTPSEPGKLWSSSAPTLLLNIADGLPMTNGDFTRNDISIPSPWSIFIMNELTLTKEKFSGINAEAYRQWCGMITLLALRKVNHYETNGLKLELPILDNKDEFCNAIRDTCKPQSYVFNNYEWIKGSCVSLNDETIAFLANNTLVCPVFSFSTKTLDTLHKIAPTIVDDNRKFTSPDTYFKDQSQTLNQDAKFALRLFLTDLHMVITKIAGLGNPSDIIKPLLDKINTFLNDLGSVTDKKDEITISPEAKNNIFSVHDIFEKLIPVATGRSINLPFELLDTVDGERTVLIGLNIAGISSTNSQAANIFLTETILFNQMTPQKILELDGKKQNDGITLVHADSLLCDTMVMVRKENNKNGFEALSHAISLQDYEVIWPVNERLLLMYTMNELNENIILEVSQENVTVSLKLRIKGIQGKAGSHTVTKTYRIMSAEAAQEQQTMAGVCVTIEKNRLPFWAVWPFAKSVKGGRNLWQRYNFLCVERNYLGIPVMEIRPVFENKKENLDGPPQKLSSISTPQNDIFYRRYSDLPVAFKLYEKTKAAPIYRGAVFIKNPPIYEQGSTEWNIGLDFGTTSTTAFFTTQSQSDPQFIQLLAEYKWAEGRSEPNEDDWENKNDIMVLADFGARRYLEEYFIDERTLKQNGYNTTYEELDESENAIDSTIFKEGRIFWHNYKNLRSVNSDIEGKRRERLRTNIKWDTNTIFTGKYLNQLMTQITYMAARNRVRKINWFFSYPTAFSLSDKGAFSTRIENITKSLTNQTGIEIVYNTKNLLTESIAAAYYFRHKNPRETVFLCVDIGGGTSDVSIWIKTKYVFQSSIRFASRDMFIEPLKKLLTGEVLSFVSKADDDPIGTMLLYKGSSNNQDKVKFFIETVLFEFYNEFRQRLDSLQGENKEAFRRFRYSVFIAYSGLVYYIANIIAELLNTNIPEKKIDNDVTRIVFGLSGKGSKLTDWIDVYCEFLYTEAQNHIAEKTKSEANPNGIFIEFSPQFEPATAKTETAIGMVCDLDNSGRQKNQVVPVDPDVFMGSDMTIIKGNVEKSYGEGDFVDTYQDFFANPKELSIKIDQNLDALDDFLQFFNRIAAKTKNDMPQVPIDKINKKDLWMQTNRQFENILASGHFDPPFIVILDVFLKEYFK